MNNKPKPPGPPAQGQQHITDNLTEQLNNIMVQMGRIMTAPKSHPDRADLIAMNARKKMDEATHSFHQTLDDMEIEITRAKGAFLRDLEKLREKKQAAEQAAAPPAPMVIDLDGLKPSGPTVPVPVAPMMATGGSPFIANRGIPKTEGKPAVPGVAPFPDMGGGGAGVGPPPAAPVPFARAKPSPSMENQQRPSPKQPTPKQTPKPAPKSNPPSGRPANKPNPLAKPSLNGTINNNPNNPLANAQKQQQQQQAPKAPPSAPPVAAPAPMAAVTPAQPPTAAAPPVVPVMQPAQPPSAQVITAAPTQNSFTNATFTLDPSNNDSSGGQPGGGSIDLDSMLDSFGAGGPGDPANMDQNEDTTMGDLDHFFDIEEAGTSNFDDANFGSSSNYMDMTDDFEFSAFE